MTTNTVTAILSECIPGERRVAMVPADVRRLAAKTGFIVEIGAGVSAGFLDDEYAKGEQRR